jgi:hypothetical protein
MATLTEVLAWRGRIRGLTRDTISDLRSILAFNTKHPTYGFLDSATLSDINNVVAYLELKLTEKRLR